jgi:hypothetical protein
MQWLGSASIKLCYLARRNWFTIHSPPAFGSSCSAASGAAAEAGTEASQIGVVANASASASGSSATAVGCSAGA